MDTELETTLSGTDALLGTLMLGGFVVWLLIAMSVLALAVVLVKFWQFGRAGVGQRKAAAQMVALHRDGLSREALALAADAKGTLTELVALALQGRARDVAEPKIREEVLRQGRDALEELRSGFRILEVIATLAPLLGLFGTVLGMIEAFRELEAAGNQVNPAILSGGIWQALLTTAVGLAVAMPTVAVLNWLERRMERLAHAMDSHITGLFTEDLAQQPNRETGLDRAQFRSRAAE